VAVVWMENVSWYEYMDKLNVYKHHRGKRNKGKRRGKIGR